jgi:ParB/RepB/Spo0J family partition protein
VTLVNLPLALVAHAACMTMASTARKAHPPTEEYADQRGRCKLCGFWLVGSRLVCQGCAERLELELGFAPARACPNCGRHRELCALMPCPTLASGRLVDASNRPQVAWLGIEAIEEPAASNNSRRRYSEASLSELAASIRAHGVLQPLCVRRAHGRYVLIFGVRRLRAARQAGLTEVPCIVRSTPDDALLLNVVENLHRAQLSRAERVRAIVRLAGSGLGVREIARRTGFNASTISRWLRIESRPVLRSAVESGQLDITRARLLVDVPDAALAAAIEQAEQVDAAELRRRVLDWRQATTASSSDQAQDRLAADADARYALCLLRRVQQVEDLSVLHALAAEVARLQMLSPTLH